MICRLQYGFPNVLLQRISIEYCGKSTQPWIEKHLENMKKKQVQYEHRELQPLTDADIRELADRALDYIPGRAEPRRPMPARPQAARMSNTPAPAGNSGWSGFCRFPDYSHAVYGVFRLRSHRRKLPATSGHRF